MRKLKMIGQGVWESKKLGSPTNLEKSLIMLPTTIASGQRLLHSRHGPKNKAVTIKIVTALFAVIEARIGSCVRAKIIVRS